MGDALGLLFGMVLEDGRRWGEAAVDVQVEDARAVLDQSSPTPYHWLGRARGYSKTTDNGAIALVAMLAQAPERARLYGLAADQAQGTLLVDAIGGFVATAPRSSQGAIQVQEFKVVATRTGATLTILPADSASVWGLRPWLAVVDELTQWHETPRTMRVWEGAHDRAGEGAGVAYGCPRDGRRSRAISHTGSVIRRSPIRCGASTRSRGLLLGWTNGVSRERSDGSRSQAIVRLFMNEWAASEDRLANEDDLAACVDDEAAHETPRPGTRYVLAVDIGVKNDRTAVVVAHAEKIPGAEFPRVVVDRLQAWTPSRLRPVRLSAVESWVAEYARRYRAPVRFDPSQALHMMQRLKRDGVRCEEFTFSSSSVGRLAVTLLTLVRQQALAAS